MYKYVYRGQVKEMLNKRKIRLMTRLTQYENKTGREDLKLSKYFRKDYIGISLFKNFFWVTSGYICLLGMIAVCFMEYLVVNFHKMNLLALAGAVIGGYVILLTIYTVMTYVTCSVRYKRASRSLDEYDKMLKNLENIYLGKETVKGGSKTRGENI